MSCRCGFGFLGRALTPSKTGADSARIFSLFPSWGFISFATSQSGPETTQASTLPKKSGKMQFDALVVISEGPKKLSIRPRWFFASKVAIHARDAADPVRV